MIDIKFLREHPDIVKENIKKKFQNHKLVLVDEVLELDKKNREAKLNGDNLRAERKSLSSEIGNLMKQGKNSCCLSGSEFTSFGLNLMTVFSRRCFSFLSNVLSFFIAKKRKNIWCGAWGCINPNIY